MNGIDYFILIIIVISVLYGAARGLIHSLFKFLGFMASVIITKNYYSYVAKFLIENTKIVFAISDIVARKETRDIGFGEGLIKSLYMVLPAGNIANDFKNYIVFIIINCIALFITFIIVKLVLTLLEILLKEVFKLPVLSTVNYSGGALFGLIESILVLLLIFALAIPISTLERFHYIGKAIEDSAFAKYFYSYNFILKWLIDGAISLIIN